MSLSALLARLLQRAKGDVSAVSDVSGVQASDLEGSPATSDTAAATTAVTVKPAPALRCAAETADTAPFDNLHAADDVPLDPNLCAASNAMHSGEVAIERIEKPAAVLALDAFLPCAEAATEHDGGPIDWRAADAAYLTHHFDCVACKAAGRGKRYGSRCPAGAVLWRRYEEAPGSRNVL